MNFPEIEFKPVKKLIIHEVITTTRDKIVYSMGHGAEAGNFGRSLFWAEGIVFAYSILPWNDQTISEYIEGYAHINSIVCAPWKEYQPIYEIPGSKIRIPIWDVSGEPAHALAKFCKRYYVEHHPGAIEGWLRGDNPA